MPLPRFARLPAAKQRTILDTAAEALARDGLDRASYNAILAAAGVSKASAYQYFDGRDDLVDTVLTRLVGELTDVLGPWRPSSNAADFSAQWRAGVRRLTARLAADPVALALAPHALRRPSAHQQAGAWVGQVVADGQRLGVVRNDLPADLLVTASAALLQALDAWALAGLPGRTEDEIDRAYSLLESMWRAP